MPESYSVNQLRTWDKCRKKFELDHIRRLQWPSNPKNFRLGKGVHQLLDYEAHAMPIEPIINGADADIVQCWQTLHQSDWAKLPVIASEWGFSLSLDGCWIYGRVDRIAQQPNGVVILDWKTGTSIPRSVETDWQTRIYLYAVFLTQRELNLSLRYDELKMAYVQAKGTQTKVVEVPYSEAAHQQTRAQLLDTLARIRTALHTQTFPLPNTCPDRHCPYQSVCGIQEVPASVDTALEPTDNLMLV